MQPTQAYHQVLRQNIGKNSYISRKCQEGLNVFFGHGEIFSVGIRDWQRMRKPHSATALLLQNSRRMKSVQFLLMLLIGSTACRDPNSSFTLPMTPRSSNALWPSRKCKTKPTRLSQENLRPGGWGASRRRQHIAHPMGRTSTAARLGSLLSQEPSLLRSEPRQRLLTPSCRAGTERAPAPAARPPGPRGAQAEAARPHAPPRAPPPLWLRHRPHLATASSRRQRGHRGEERARGGPARPGQQRAPRLAAPLAAPPAAPELELHTHLAGLLPPAARSGRGEALGRESALRSGPAAGGALRDSRGRAGWRLSTGGSASGASRLPPSSAELLLPRAAAVLRRSAAGPRPRTTPWRAGGSSPGRAPRRAAAAGARRCVLGSSRALIESSRCRHRAAFERERCENGPPRLPLGPRGAAIAGLRETGPRAAPARLGGPGTLRVRGAAGSAVCNTAGGAPLGARTRSFEEVRKRVGGSCLFIFDNNSESA